MRHWHLRVGAPVHRPFLGIERETLHNGWLWRVSLWPRRTGFYLVLWKEPPSDGSGAP